MQSLQRCRKLILSLTAGLLLPVGLSAQAVPPELEVSLLPKAKPIVESKQAVRTKRTMTLAPDGPLTAKPQKQTAAAQPKRGAISSTADLAGKKVMTARSLRSDSFGDDGNACTISTIAGTDSIIIKGFWNDAITLKAKVNVAEGTITIPNQVVGQMVDNGNIDIAFCQSNGKPDRKKNITGVINADGSISINDWWGIYVVAGTNKDRYPFAGGDTKIYPANGTMTFNFLDGTKFEQSVYITQPYDNRVMITNFGNYGQTVYVNLNSSRSGDIPSQVARQYPANKAHFYTYAIGSYTSNGQPNDITPTIKLKTAAAGNNNTLEWGNWSAISNGTQLMYFGAITDGKITYDGNFVYPTAVSGQLEGEGTEASPYLITSLRDLKVLAQMVNSVPESEYNGFLNGVNCARVFRGKHFRLTNDIDMAGTLFTPIGADAYHYFGGIFDGQNHTLKNMSVSSTTGLAALFGLVDPEGVIKNIKMDKPTVTSQGQTAGSVCGWNFGTIDNCHVTNANITNYARIAGGVVGVGTIVTNCSISDSYILGANGNPAGIVGQINAGTLTNCHAVRTTVIGATGSAGLPAGGVAAAIDKTTASNLSFSGLVDTRTYMCTMSTGGVIGVLSNSTLDQAFATGEVKAGPSDNMNRPSCAGGVAGKTYGGKIENCFFTGKVSTYTNRMAGGITGWLCNEVQGTDTVATTIRNCYTASSVQSETYLYDKEKEARETIGWIDATSSPTLENLYFDNQLTNLNSTRFGTTTAALTSATGITGFDANVWQFTAGQYPRLKISATQPNALAAASALVLPARSSLKKVSADAELHPLGDVKYLLVNKGNTGTEGHFCSIADGKLKITTEFGTDTLRVSNGNVYYDLELRIAPVPFLGEGTEQNPFLISTHQDLLTLAHVTSEILQTFPGDYFLMTNDIDMENDSTFLGICAQPGTAGTHNKFAGVFDGGNHSIKNLHMRKIVWKTRPEESSDGMGTPNSSASNGVMGFFGRLAPEGIIRNLIMDKSCDFQFWSRSGSIVGQNEGLVENCRNHADVWAASAVPGGIVGENRKGHVRRCYNDGTITTGSNGAGGIVATGDGIIEECVNVGTVRAKIWTKFQTNVKSVYRVGGIQGENKGTNFIDCVNFGSIEGYKEVGGIAGELKAVTSTTVLGKNELHRVLNFGNLVSTDAATTGSLGGASGTTGAIEYAHWDSQIIPEKAHGAISLKGASGLATSVFTSGTPVAGFSAEIWDFAKDKYPVPAWCKDEPMLQHARSLVVTFPKGASSANFHGTATLNGLDGHTWTLAENDPYTISGKNLKAPESVNAQITGTLTGVSGNYRRVLPLVSNIAVPLQGAGTQDDPYRIATVEDWTALAEYIPSANDNFTDKFLKVVADIDFEGKTFKPIFTGTLSLEGTLDGGGHTLKNIDYTVVNSYEAVIGTIDASGVLTNFSAQGNIKTTQANTGGITAKVYGTLRNCDNKMNITATKGAGHSGFGYFYATTVAEKVTNHGTITGANGQLAGISHNVSAEGATFTDCVNYGVIKSTSTSTSCNNFGGLVATCFPATFTKCHNEGSFEFNKPEGSNQVGGLIGNANASSATTKKMILTGCYNLTNITANNYLGGLIGNMSNGNCSLLITDCYNRGNIASVATKSTTGSPTAGITGYYTLDSEIRNCNNYGKISSTKNVFISGIAAYYKSAPTEAKPTYIVNCHNFGDIDAQGNQGAGMVGCGNNWLFIDSCSNRGNITGGFGLAGICSNFSSATSKISNCWNEGNITTSANRSGGIVGWGNAQGQITDCFNLGQISTTNTTCGTSASSGYDIGGIAGYTGSIVTRCYNLGTIVGTSRVAGITGETFKNHTQLINCYNAGEIVANADTCGSLIGLNPANGGAWSQDNKVENCYYIKQEQQPTHDSYFPGMLSQKELCAMDLGEGWIKGDNFTYPVLKTVNTESARLNAACVIFDGNDNFSKVTYNFSVGCPDGVTWSSDRPEVRFDGTRVRFNKGYVGPMTLTAKLGDLTRTFNLNVDNPTGVDEVDGAEIINEEWFTLDGIRLGQPGQHGIFIVKRTYSNGERRTSKVNIP